MRNQNSNSGSILWVLFGVFVAFAIAKNPNQDQMAYHLQEKVVTDEKVFLASFVDKKRICRYNFYLISYYKVEDLDWKNKVKNTTLYEGFMGKIQKIEAMPSIFQDYSPDKCELINMADAPSVGL